MRRMRYYLQYFGYKNNRKSQYNNRQKIFGDKTMEYSFNLYNNMAQAGVLMALNSFIGVQTAPPVILCIGTDLAIGDSLGPVCGTMLESKSQTKNFFLYGTLKKPVTAKETKYLNEFLKETHPNSKIIAIDAAVGTAGDIGLIKIHNKGLKPGLGVNKKLQTVGDVSIMGIVAEKSVFNYSLLNATRLNLVYKMADIISDSVSTYVSSLSTNQKSAV